MNRINFSEENLNPGSIISAIKSDWLNILNGRLVDLIILESAQHTFSGHVAGTLKNLPPGLRSCESL